MPSHRQLAAWYFALGQSLGAGLPLIEVLESPGGPRPRERRALAQRLRDGAPLAVALPEQTGWLPATDVAQLRAGAQAGRLPEVCGQLAAQHELVARLAGRAWLALAYPLAVLHFGAFLMPVQELVLGTAGGYAAAVASTLVPLWLVAALVAIPLVRHASVRRRVMAVLPGFAGYQEARDLHALTSVLQGFVAAGVPLSEAWPAAGAATGAPRLAALGDRLGAEAGAGRPPGARLPLEPDFPTQFAALYVTGERTGKLDEQLAWIARQCGERAEGKLKLVSLWYPQLALLAVGGWVLVKVVMTYGRHLDDMLKIME